jgi:hypothetical protein
MTLSERIAELVRTRLDGRKIDVVGFVEALLDLAKDVGAIRCSLSGDAGLRFELGNQDTCDIELDGYRGKLRMLCARLSVLCAQNPYGGEGSIRMPPKNGAGDAEWQWTVQFKNTPDEHGFTIVAVGVEKTSAALSRSIES